MCLLGAIIALQLARMGFKKIIFLFFERNLITDVISTSVFMLIIIAFSLIVIKKKNYHLHFFPQKFSRKYIIVSLLYLIFMVTTPLITQQLSLYEITSFIYGSVITVVYEEIIFRGFIYKAVSNLKNEKNAYFISTLMFGIWHLGYIDTIIWRTGLFFQESNIAKIMFYKVITGLVFGIILGFFRYKNKNVYSSMLAHSFLNAFGG